MFFDNELNKTWRDTHIRRVLYMQKPNQTKTPNTKRRNELDKNGIKSWRAMYKNKTYRASNSSEKRKIIRTKSKLATRSWGGWWFPWWKRSNTIFHIARKSFKCCKIECGYIWVYNYSSKYSRSAQRPWSPSLPSSKIVCLFSFLSISSAETKELWREERKMKNGYFIAMSECQQDCSAISALTS